MEIILDFRKLDILDWCNPLYVLFRWYIFTTKVWCYCQYQQVGNCALSTYLLFLWLHSFYLKCDAIANINKLEIVLQAHILFLWLHSSLFLLKFCINVITIIRAIGSLCCGYVWLCFHSVLIWSIFFLFFFVLATSIFKPSRCVYF